MGPSWDPIDVAKCHPTSRIRPNFHSQLQKLANSSDHPETFGQPATTKSATLFEIPLPWILPSSRRVIVIISSRKHPNNVLNAFYEVCEAIMTAQLPLGIKYSTHLDLANIGSQTAINSRFSVFEPKSA